MFEPAGKFFRYYPVRFPPINSSISNLPVFPISLYPDEEEQKLNVDAKNPRLEDYLGVEVYCEFSRLRHLAMYFNAYMEFCCFS